MWKNYVQTQTRLNRQHGKEVCQSEELVLPRGVGFKTSNLNNKYWMGCQILLSKNNTKIVKWIASK
jgi:hypothetical protein